MCEEREGGNPYRIQENSQISGIALTTDQSHTFSDILPLFASPLIVKVLSKQESQIWILC